MALILRLEDTEQFLWTRIMCLINFVAILNMTYFIKRVKHTFNTLRLNCSKQFCILNGTMFLNIFLWIVPFSLLLSSNQVHSLFHTEYI